MKMSDAYNELVRQINASASEKKYGYNLALLDMVLDSEREKAEDLIWRTFFDEKDIDLLMFLPKLKYYDGIKELRKMAPQLLIPSYTSMRVNFVVFENTKEIRFLKLMEKNILSSDYNFQYLALMRFLTPCEEVYQSLKNLYISCNQEESLPRLVEGILYNKGFIKDIMDINEIMSKSKIRNLLRVPLNEREAIIEKLENGEFDSYKC